MCFYFIFFLGSFGCLYWGDLLNWIHYKALSIINFSVFMSTFMQRQKYAWVALCQPLPLSLWAKSLTSVNIKATELFLMVLQVMPAWSQQKSKRIKGANKLWVFAAVSVTAIKKADKYCTHMSTFTDNDRDFRIALFTLLLAVLLAGLCGNATVCHTFRKNPSLRTVTNHIIINMAATAIAHCLLNIPVTLINLALDRWALGQAYCLVNGLTNSVCLFESMFSLVLLCISRYWCILHPTRFQAIFSKQRTLFMIALSWFFSFALSSPPLFGWSRYHFCQGKMMCVSMWKHSISYTSFIAIMVFLLPSFSIIAVYYKIYKHIKSHQRLLKLYTFAATAPLCPTSHRANFSKSIFKDYQITKLIWTLFIIFVASWVPYFGVNLVFEAVEGDIPRSVDAILTWITIFNTACSPIIYGLVNRQFRKGFWEGIRCFKNGEVTAKGHRRWRSRFRDSLDWRSSLRTFPQTSRTHFNELNVNEAVWFVSAVWACKTFGQRKRLSKLSSRWTDNGTYPW